MPQKQKLSAKEKAKIVQDYLQGTISQSEAARRGGVVRETLIQWANNYQADGIEAFLPHKNRTYSPELKRHAVEDYLSGGGSQIDICKKYHVRKSSQLQRWIQVYNKHGDFNSVKHSGGGSYMKQGRNTTQEERIKIVKDCLASGRNYGEMALKYNVSYQQVRTWTLRFEQLGEAGLEDRRGRRKKDQEPRTELEKAQIEIEQLKHKLYMAEMERDLLKKWDEIERRDAFRK
ncbi:MAG: transposase [Lachnospiraceae bacterium]|nr:transposase [Lachnospiraceae bacterium]